MKGITIPLWAKGAAALLVWGAAYALNPHASAWLVAALGLEAGTTAGEAVHFFVYDTVKILLLLAFMVYLMAFLRAGLQADRLREKLSSANRGLGYLLGAAFGAVTPFCSCSSIPLFLGFTTAGIPLGIALSFLIASPMINEIAVILLGGLLGWPFATAYVAVGILAGVAAGALADAVGAERWVRGPANKPGLTELRPLRGLPVRITPEGRHRFALNECRTIFRRVAPWVIVGVGLGALLHGFVPEQWVTERLGSGQWWTVPLAVIAGVPLYANVTGIVPILESLLMKGVPAGTALAFCMSTVAVSLPELLMLRQVMRGRLLALFVGVLAVFCTLAGWFFNAVFPVMGGRL